MELFVCHWHLFHTVHDDNVGHRSTSVQRCDRHHMKTISPVSPYQMHPNILSGHPSIWMEFNEPQSPRTHIRSYSYQIPAGASTSFRVSYPGRHRSIIRHNNRLLDFHLIWNSEWSNINRVKWFTCQLSNENYSYFRKLILENVHR